VYLHSVAAAIGASHRQPNDAMHSLADAPGKIREALVAA